MTRVLDIIQDYLDYMDYSYERLDGSVKSEDRYKAIKNFMDDKKDVFIFLLSTRAGGLGLNLTAGNKNKTKQNKTKYIYIYNTINK